MPPRSRRQWRAGSLIILVLGCFAAGRGASGAPAWWRAGRPRTVHRSYAEVELLSHLAVLLKPKEPIGELFRDFPVEPSEDWGARWLCPDIAVYGVLRQPSAILFIEYDGHPRHYNAEGQHADDRKTRALVKHAPFGSKILRIGHARRCLARTKDSFEVIVDAWRRGRWQSLQNVVYQAACALICVFAGDLQPGVWQRLQCLQHTGKSLDFHDAGEFVSKVLLTSDVENKKASMRTFLQMELGFSNSCMDTLGDKFPSIWGVNIEGNLRPTVAWLEDVGLSRAQVAKVIAVKPQVLGLSIEGNLRPTVAWLEDVGLSRAQVAKVIAVFPSVLGYSIEGNLRPTVAWLEDVGLSRAQVAKVIAVCPSVLG